jgi:hypothetical protein
MAGMIYMGEYSSACLCEVPPAPLAMPPPQGGPGAAPVSSTSRPRSMLGAAGAGGATAGVVMQMRREAERQNHRY